MLAIQAGTDSELHKPVGNQVVQSILDQPAFCRAARCVGKVDAWPPLIAFMRKVSSHQQRWLILPRSKTLPLQRCRKPQCVPCIPIKHFVEHEACQQCSLL